MILALAILLLVISAIGEAVMDTVSHHFYTSIFSFRNDMFWNPIDSWRNKYKDGDINNGPKFFGSTTFLVWTTDAWHLFKTIHKTGLRAGWAFIGVTALSVDWYYAVGIVLASLGLSGMVFELFYKKLLKRSTWKTKNKR